MDHKQSPNTGEVSDEQLEQLLEELTPDRIVLLPFYHDLRNKIIRPKNVVVETKYFFRKWKPLLGTR